MKDDSSSDKTPTVEVSNIEVTTTEKSGTKTHDWPRVTVEINTHDWPRIAVTVKAGNWPNDKDMPQLVDISCDLTVSGD